MMNKTKKNGKGKTGGKVIDSGGFGCVFKPSLRCKTKKKHMNGISKMSLSKYSKQEIYEINRIYKRLKNIKNYDKYFLLEGIKLCQPEKLTQKDLVDFNKKCFALKRSKITSKNINERLNEVSIINMPDGGITIDNWLLNVSKLTTFKIIELNNLILDLMINGIYEMNKRNIVHNDMKGSNILIDTNNNTRIIDWGLAGISKNNKIPEEIKDRPLQFNTPFSSMILSSKFNENYKKFLKKISNGEMLFNRTNVRNFVNSEYLEKISSHYEYYDDNVKIFNLIFKNIIGKPKHEKVNKKGFVEYGYYLYYLSNYITDILLKYTVDNKFEVDKYFMECYRFNSDIYGLFTIYYMFFYLSYDKTDMQEEEYRVFLNRIRSFLVENIFVNGHEKINTEKLKRDIISINMILRGFKNNGVESISTNINSVVTKYSTEL
jgi:hypothetical protein